MLSTFGYNIRMSIQDLAAEEGQGYKTTQAMVIGGLRKGILSGVLKGGQPLRQGEIAESFGVSRIPVREALRQLEGEGLISFYPHRGAVVSELSFEEAREISDIRVALETAAIRRAIPLLKKEDLERAGEILGVIDRERDLISRWGELNRRFHTTLYAPMNRPRLLALIESQHTAFDRYIRVHLALNDYEKPQWEHYQLLELCRRGEVGGAVELLTRHIEDIADVLYTHLQREQGGNAASSGADPEGS